ncbi:hypothetical protein CALCODRAFT_505435 [Calocera cornea HHB12733]|uniref:BZIP domain-containing protein n=1 Tax=Calocera cornea HHB12733 TaxID=1353952 RepID=A0A165K4I4_9BASI|nr:hypothetical protein CALCODRAFT_505435 [Calocera cornea HHB12733]
MTQSISTSQTSAPSSGATLFSTITLPSVERQMWLPTMPIPTIDRTEMQPTPTSAPTTASTSCSPPPTLNRNGAQRLSSEAIASAAYEGAARGQYEEKPHAYSGFRKGLSPNQLLPVQAPTERRTYYVESATSRRDGPRPAEVYRVTSPSTSVSPSADGAEPFESSSVSDVVMSNNDSRAQNRVDTVSTSPAEVDSMVARMQQDRSRRRSQNTLAARRSRARKLDTMLKLESERDNALARVEDLERRLTDALTENAALRGRLNMVETGGGT